MLLHGKVAVTLLGYRYKIYMSCAILFSFRVSRLPFRRTTEVSQEIRTCLQRRSLGGYLRVIEAPPHPDAQVMAQQTHPNTVTNNIIRTYLELKHGAEHDFEVPPHTILKDYFGLYSVSGKAYRTYGGPSKFFGEISPILMEYAFAHTNPSSMPQKKAAIIIKEYQGRTVDWGILTGEGV